ncbi:MAG: hypothetical protein IJN67_10705 [Oscillospiraceae bacterium]|nr:hypothetical protein [Oscillospiraceae bacterium]
MKKLENWFRSHKRMAAGCVFLFFALLACSSFPIYNLTKQYSNTLTFTNVFVSVSIYAYLGGFLTRLLPKAQLGQVFLIHLAVILGGMLARFLLEFGEVSNTYNFIPANIALHLAVTLTISPLSWWWTKRHPL